MVYIVLWMDCILNLSPYRHDLNAWNPLFYNIDGMFRDNVIIHKEYGHQRELHIIIDLLLAHNGFTTSEWNSLLEHIVNALLWLRFLWPQYRRFSQTIINLRTDLPTKLQCAIPRNHCHSVFYWIVFNHLFFENITMVMISFNLHI